MHKCSWKHCQHENRDINGEDFYTDDGIVFYHNDCHEQMQIINKIIEIWHKNIDSIASESTLKSVINKLVYDKKYDVQYILYVVNIGSREGWLHYPYGLYKSVNNRELMNNYNDIKAKELIKGIPQKRVDDYKSETCFKFFNKQKRGFSRIIGG